MTLGELSSLCMNLLLSQARRTETIVGLPGRSTEKTDVGIVILTKPSITWGTGLWICLWEVSLLC